MNGSARAVGASTRRPPTTPFKRRESRARTAPRPRRQPQSPRSTPLELSLRKRPEGPRDCRGGTPIRGRCRSPFVTASCRTDIVSTSRTGRQPFKDKGRQPTTPSENTQVVHSLIEIAHSRGWTEVTVTGTERFRREAWRQARLAGLSVRGYGPSEAEQAQLIRALARSRLPSAERVDAISADAPTEAPRPSGAPSLRDSSRPGRLKAFLESALWGSSWITGAMPTAMTRRKTPLISCGFRPGRGFVRCGARTSNAPSRNHSRSLKWVTSSSCSAAGAMR